MHLKRSKAEKGWPIPRKGTTYLARSNHAQKKGVSLLMVLRDILGIAETKKEARHMLLNEDVKVNGKIRKSEKFPMQFFDVLTLDKTKKNYRLNIVNKKFTLEEVSGKDSESKIVKIIGKKILDKKRIQINLEDGTNSVYDKSFNVNDSAVVDFKSNKIISVLPLKTGAKVEIISGKHSGEKGSLKDIVKLDKTKRYKIKLKEGEVDLPIETFFVVK